MPREYTAFERFVRDALDWVQTVAVVYLIVGAFVAFNLVFLVLACFWQACDLSLVRPP